MRVPRVSILRRGRSLVAPPRSSAQ